MSHGVIIESEEEKGRHAYDGRVGVMWHPWQVVTSMYINMFVNDDKSTKKKMASIHTTYLLHYNIKL